MMSKPLNVRKGVKGFTSKPLEDRFWAKVDKRGKDDCWPWTGEIASKELPYGSIWDGGKNRRATQVSWEIHNDGKPFPDGMSACHKCDNPNCVNPNHIFAGTHQENMQDAGNKGRLSTSPTPQTHCRKGHEFTEENTYTYPKTGHRLCRTCQRARHKRYMAKKKAKAEAKWKKRIDELESENQRLRAVLAKTKETK